MRIYIRNQLIELFPTIMDGVKYAKKTDVENAKIILSDCFIAVEHIENTLNQFLSSEHFSSYQDLINSLKTYLNEMAVQKEDGKISSSYINSIQKSLHLLKKQLQQESEVKLEIAFMPYKASMWDSLESIWIAANQDDRCNAYVVPIPYYERDSNRNLSKFYYEGFEFPADVPITSYEEYNLEKRRPDVIYIHNPYDGNNYVTSVDPRFYSNELKKYTDMLVYVPYYATSGGMSEGQRSCSAYYYADYIITQSAEYRKFFDKNIPNHKFLPLGSPKFDKIINTCKNPPEFSTEWKKRAEGKKVYFYNTSISGLLENTEVFFNKIKYVFKCFECRTDALLLWRPHPLLETTINSMRLSYKDEYIKIKQYFIDNNLGIYDDTPDITTTIAFCDAYIGDSGTSITSLFGIAGKPVFVLNNNINVPPEEDDWHSKIYVPRFYDDKTGLIIIDGNRLYSVDKSTMKYKYICNLSEDESKFYFVAHKIKDKIYSVSLNSPDICIVDENNKIKTISLKSCSEKSLLFVGMMVYENYIVLVPNHYHSIVRYDTQKNRIDYFDKNINVFTSEISTEKAINGMCLRDNLLFIVSSVDNTLLQFDILTGKEQVFKTGANNGSLYVADDGELLWLLPKLGTTITSWNPKTKEIREYSDYPAGFQCKNSLTDIMCMESPFVSAVCFGDDIIFAPHWANMFVKINKNTGKISEWIPPSDIKIGFKNPYYKAWMYSSFVMEHTRRINKNNECLLFTFYDNTFYKINLATNEYEKIIPDIDVQQLKSFEKGFNKQAEYLRYACMESVFNSLSGFLGGNITGNKFDKEKQINCYNEIAANNDGTCGKKTNDEIINRFMKR